GGAAHAGDRPLDCPQTQRPGRPGLAEPVVDGVSRRGASGARAQAVRRGHRAEQPRDRETRAYRNGPPPTHRDPGTPAANQAIHADLADGDQVVSDVSLSILSAVCRWAA